MLSCLPEKFITPSTVKPVGTGLMVQILNGCHPLTIELIIVKPLVSGKEGLRSIIFFVDILGNNLRGIFEDYCAKLCSKSPSWLRVV
jgi:hypothetical protein